MTATDKTVDVNTDNLDDFNDLLQGNAKPLEAVDPEDTEDELEETSETPSATDDASDEAEVEESDEDEESSDGDETADDQDDEEEEAKPQPRKRKPARERISELTRRLREAEDREAAALRKLQERETSADTDRKDDSPAPTGAPDPDELLPNGEHKYPLGEFDKQFIADFTRFTVEQQTAEARQKAEVERTQREAEAAERELLSSWDEKLEDAEDRMPGFHEKIADLESDFRDLDPNYGKFLATTIMSMEYGPDVLAYLADNPKVARSIVNSGPTMATLALGRIEAQFSVSESKQVEREKVVVSTSAPPPPVVRTKGSGTGRVIADDTDDLEAFEKKFFKK